jgi:chaperonin GroEL
LFDDMFKKESGRPRVGRSVVLRGKDAVAPLKRGLDLAVDTVGATMGPRGKCVIIQGEEGDPPVVTKDGVTVSKAVDPVDVAERMGAQLVREAASRTNDEAGDGTTTASVLTGALVSSVVKYVGAGMEPSEVKKGLDAATARVLEEVAKVAERIDTEEALRDIATISANGDVEIGTLVAQAVHKTGVDGVVAVENARSATTSLEIVEGLRFERGYLSPYFVTDQEKMRAAYEDCAVLVTDRKLSSLKDIIPLLEDCQRNNKPLLIVADEVDGDAMQGLVLNRAQGGLRVVAVKMPGAGAERDAQMRDLIALVGGEHPTTSSGIKVDQITLKQAGFAKKVVVDAKTTTIVGRADAQPRVADRVKELRGQLEDATISKEEVDAIRKRLAKLSSGAAIVRVGGATELELVEKKYRIEDALHAAKAALEEGILPGGGAALYKVQQNLAMFDEDVKAILAKGDSAACGWKAVLEACCSPLRRIAQNAGQSPDVVCERMNGLMLRSDPTENVGWDAAAGEIKDLRKAGIVDPAKVTRCALRNAASVAGVFLLLDAVVHEPKKEKSE